MARYAAFLRAINVGGHVVTMERLRECFAACGFKGAETFLASGNVVFSSGGKADALEKKIAARLRAELGYEVATFVRAMEEVAAVAAYEAFPGVLVEKPAAVNVGFLRAPMTPDGVRVLMGFRTGTDDFHVAGREIYWLCRTRQSDSEFTNARFEKAAGVQATFRGMNTVSKLAAKYGEGR